MGCRSYITKEKDLAVYVARVRKYTNYEVCYFKVYGMLPGPITQMKMDIYFECFLVKKLTPCPKLKKKVWLK